MALSLAVGLGLGSTWLIVENGRGFGRIDIGAWSLWPKANSPEADPYAKAAVARMARIPLSVGEGLTLEASRDSDGKPIEGRCTYLINGDLPPARLWTLTAYDKAGRIRDNPAQRYSFTSSEIIRDASGRFEITLSPDVSPGNWLPVVGGQAALLLRLYDTPVSSSPAQIDETLIPRIDKVRCP